MVDRPPRILLVDDEQSLQTLLSYPLRKDGYEVVQATDGREALARFGEQAFDLVVLDVMMPKLDGLEVCKRLRARSTVPIIMLTAKTDEIDKVLGLELGADDYLTKPFSPRELVVRLKTILRRQAGPPTGHVLAVGSIVLDPLQRRVEASGRVVQLTSTEFDLLAKLMSSPGQVFTREQLLSSVWGQADYGLGRTVDVHVAQVRSKLGDASPIVTSRGVGYSVAR